MTITITSSSSTSPRARGEEFGVEWRSDIASTWSAYERLFAQHSIAATEVRDIASRTWDAVAAWSAPLAEEMAGLASGSDLDEWQVAALNARSEILTRSRLGAPGECSTVVSLDPARAPLTIQTWDWQHVMTDVKVIWKYEARPGRTVKTFTEFGILAKVGVNSSGLGVHFNLLQHRADGEGVGIPVHVVARRLLDEAATLDDAEAIVRSADVTASAAITVVAKDESQSADEAAWSARTFELSPVGVAVLDPDNDGFLFHTNHFIDPKLAEGERLGVTDEDTYARLAELGRRTQLWTEDDFNGRVEALVQHAEDGAAICCHPAPEDPEGDSWATQLVVGLDVARGALEFQDGTPCTAVHSGYVRF